MEKTTQETTFPEHAGLDKDVTSAGEGECNEGECSDHCLLM